VKRAELEHIIRAAATIADDDELLARLTATEVDEEVRRLVAALIQRDYSGES